MKSVTDRLLTYDREYDSLKDRAMAVLKEGESKGYDILPANDPKNKYYGAILLKTIDGVEVEYYVRWEKSAGAIKCSFVPSLPKN